MSITFDEFRADEQGRSFADVLADTRVSFQLVIDFFNRPDVLRRMEESEEHHDRPPLAGVIKEFESIPDIDNFLGTHDGHTTTRFRQAVGALVRMHMEALGWQKTGRKGSLGTRAKVAAGSRTPGAYQNAHGLARWFTRCERYVKPAKV